LAFGTLAGIGLLCAAVLLTVPAAAGVIDPTPRRAPDTTPLAAPDDGYQWPLDDTPLVTRRFDPPPAPWRSGHRGVDLAGQPDAAVRAAGSGVVHFAGPLGGRGVVSIQHADGLRTTYEPVQPLVAVGDRVRTGDVIGRLAAGHPGCLAAACLHWGLRTDGGYLDPLCLLGLGRVRLLPVTGPPGS
jgi:murein DD-endopeptidase MepM/ murein hydrolase activator NlpD